MLAAAQLTVGALMLGAALPWIGRQPIMLSSTVVLSVVALGVLSTGIAYVLNYRLIQDEGPTAASMTNYLAPVVAVVLGVAFVDERLSWNLVAGTANGPARSLDRRTQSHRPWVGSQRHLGAIEDDVTQPQERIR